MPAITEDLDLLLTRLRSECEPQLRPRLHLLVLLQSGQVTTRRQAAAHLAVHRNTITGWRRQYRHGGLAALLTYKEPGAPAGQKTLPPAVFTQLKTRLATATGFASHVAIQHWLREEFTLEVPYQILHGIVCYQLKAKLKLPLSSHAKKNVAAAADFVKQCPRRPSTIATLGMQTPEQPVRVFYQDESRLGLHLRAPPDHGAWCEAPAARRAPP